MLDDSPRITFRLGEAVFAQAQQLAARCEQSLSQLMRDAIGLVLANPAPYLALLSSRVLARHPAPTPAQQGAFERYAVERQATLDRLLATYTFPDLGPLIAACEPSSEALHTTREMGTNLAP
jgi:hypothetical protein